MYLVWYLTVCLGLLQLISQTQVGTSAFLFGLRNRRVDLNPASLEVRSKRAALPLGWIGSLIKRVELQWASIGGHDKRETPPVFHPKYRREHFLNIELFDPWYMKANTSFTVRKPLWSICLIILSGCVCMSRHNWVSQMLAISGSVVHGQNTSSHGCCQLSWGLTLIWWE